MKGYKTRFIPQEHAEEIVNLYHLTKVALSGKDNSRYALLLLTAKWYHEKYPEVSTTAAYKDTECITQL